MPLSLLVEDRDIWLSARRFPHKNPPQSCSECTEYKCEASQGHGTCAPCGKGPAAPNSKSQHRIRPCTDT
jgi:hypothetical protein